MREYFDEEVKNWIRMYKFVVRLATDKIMSFYLNWLMLQSGLSIVEKLIYNEKKYRWLISSEVFDIVPK